MLCLDIFTPFANTMALAILSEDVQFYLFFDLNIWLSPQTRSIT
ncbi:hypothetical protein PJ15_0624 [Acinetobacter sp. neg1]|nr:hypothetical protein PJ15_0624 [Acinetobacter sp. neg1]